MFLAVTDHPRSRGEYRRSPGQLLADPDHPRSRGEYTGPGGVVSGEEGSSPLSRGIPLYPNPGTPTRGIIPALAGNTLRRPFGLHLFQDHPRSRGEYMPVSEEYGLGLGSSPLSRGIRPCCQICGNGGRIIPALAGNTIDSLHHLCPISDHPRSRGEYDSYGDVVVKGAGSSPLSRGIPVGFARSPDTARIIPALAGNTGECLLPVYPGSDHPRSRGEYQIPRDRSIRNLGSSPLSRGIRTGHDGMPASRRIIPALAGNTRAGGHRRPR